jgi:hypothetical protein
MSAPCKMPCKGGLSSRALTRLPHLSPRSLCRASVRCGLRHGIRAVARRAAAVAPRAAAGVRARASEAPQRAPQRAPMFCSTCRRSNAGAELVQQARPRSARTPAAARRSAHCARSPPQPTAAHLRTCGGVRAAEARAARRAQIFEQPGRDWAATDNLLNALVLVINDDPQQCVAVRVGRCVPRPLWRAQPRAPRRAARVRRAAARCARCWARCRAFRAPRAPRARPAPSLLLLRPGPA